MHELILCMTNDGKAHDAALMLARREKLPQFNVETFHGWTDLVARYAREHRRRYQEVFTIDELFTCTAELRAHYKQYLLEL